MLLGVIAAGAVRLWHAGRRAEPLPVLGTIPPFELVERSGARVSAADLAGRPWVADFVFTRCTGICPLLSATMSGLERRLGERGRDEVRLVSISVDPLHDTPEVLRRYADGYQASAGRWLFLTGERGPVYDLVKEGFRLSVGDRPPDGGERPDELITHSDRLVLVDRELQIRGYYHGTEPDAADAVLRDLDRLARER